MEQRLRSKNPSYAKCPGERENMDKNMPNLIVYSYNDELYSPSVMAGTVVMVID
jgi:hypothetical protein